MAGHSKWANIRHKKGAADKKRGKIFSKMSKEITSAVRQGLADPDANPRLRSAIAAARAANMPNDNIERAIKKGTGELGSGSLDELLYEVYGPGGVAIVIDVLTDNRNRSAANVRAILNKAHLTLADSGAVSRLFHMKSRFLVAKEQIAENRLLELLLEADIDVEEVIPDEEMLEVIAAPEAFNQIVELLEKQHIHIEESEVTQIPELTVDADLETAQKIIHLVETLEEDEDVSKVYTSMNVSEEIMNQLED